MNHLHLWIAQHQRLSYLAGVAALYLAVTAIALLVLTSEAVYDPYQERVDPLDQDGGCL